MIPAGIASSARINSPSLPTPFAAFSFDSVSDRTINDASGNSRNLTLTEGTISASGHTGSGLVSANAAGAAGSVTPSNIMTVAMWFSISDFNPPKGYGYPVLFEALGNATDPISNGLFLEIDGATHKLEIWLGYDQSASYGTPLELDTWYHAAFVFRPDLQKLYVNGVLVGTAALEKQNTFQNTASINGSLSYGNSGIVDDVYVFDTELSDSQITALMNQPITP